MGQGRRCNPFRPVRRSLFSLKFPGPPLIHTALWHGSHVKVQHNIHLPVSVHCGQAWCSNSDLWNADEVNAEKLWVADSAGELPCFFILCPFAWLLDEEKKIDLHMWHTTGSSESSDSQLQTAACPVPGHKGRCYHWTHKQRLDVLLEWIAMVCITPLIEAERSKVELSFSSPGMF